MKEPINVKELQDQFNDPEGFSYEGFLSYNKYRTSPVASFRYAGASRIKGILNVEHLNCCAIAIERSSGTSFNLVPGVTARELIDKCLKKNMIPKFIKPGQAFSFSDSAAEPGAPIEIKFYFYSEWRVVPYKTREQIEAQKQEEDSIRYNIEQTINAFKLFYTLDEVEITGELMESIIKNQPTYIKLELVNERTHVKGMFTLAEALTSEE